MYIATVYDLLDYYQPGVQAAGVILNDNQQGLRLPVRYTNPKTFSLEFRKERKCDWFVLKDPFSAKIPDILGSLNLDPINPKNILNAIIGADGTYNDPAAAVAALNNAYADMLAKNQVNAFIIALRLPTNSRNLMAMTLQNGTVFNRSVGNLIQVYNRKPYNLSFTFQST